MGERTGKRDNELGERHAVWRIPAPTASLLSTPTPLSKRHYKWGPQILMVDIDFPVIEFGYENPVAIVDYKWVSLDSLQPDRYTPTNRALGCLHIKDGQSYRPLPFIAALYRKDPWIFRLVPMNEEADRLLKSRSYIVSELQYVKWLYQLRRVPFPAQLARELNTYIPTKKEAPDVEPLSTVIADTEQVALFDEVPA